VQNIETTALLRNPIHWVGVKIAMTKKKNISGIVILAAIILAAIFLSLTIKPAAALTTPSIDGTPVTLNEASGSGAMALPPMTTTIGVDDVLIVSYLGDSGVNIDSITSTGNPTWIERANVQLSSGSSGPYTLSTWYAVWSSTGSTTITLTLNGPKSNTHCVAVALAVKDANTVSPFDINAVTATGPSGGATASITTLQNNDLVIGVLGTKSQSSYPSSGAGFTNLACLDCIGKSRIIEVESQIASTAAPITVNYVSSSDQPWCLIADAIAPYNALFVTPEYNLGTIIALSACLVAFALFAIKKKRK
jgi:hypothetical protein